MAAEGAVLASGAVNGCGVLEDHDEELAERGVAASGADHLAGARASLRLGARVDACHDAPFVVAGPLPDDPPGPRRRVVVAVRRETRRQPRAQSSRSGGALAQDVLQRDAGGLAARGEQGAGLLRPPSTGARRGAAGSGAGRSG
ncbi:hypothetical protein ACIQVK_19615 [Streptomyces sp. NPDC090493]|uniref:hypothetical protein n=1 Tax=Streptomyces sp. NPDC090493 TaxID=3365964 RepID=UPI0038210136